jgi:hypothetical protein
VKHTNTKTALLLSLILVSSWVVAAIGARYPTITTRGKKIFERQILQAWGGVILQGTTEFQDSSGKIVSPRKLKLQLDTHPDMGEQVCINYQNTCYIIRMTTQNAIPLATWVFSGQTGAFTAFEPEPGEEVQLRKVYGGYTPIELDQGTIPQILAFIDFRLATEPFDDKEIRNKYNQRLGSNFNPSSLQFESSSHLLTDTDTKYKALLINKQVQLTGLIKKYYWILFQGVEYPYIYKVFQACDPASIRSQDKSKCPRVGLIPRSMLEQRYKAQEEALLLTQVTAIFRTFADNNCKELSKFLKTHSKTYHFPDNQCEKLRELAKEDQSS